MLDRNKIRKDAEHYLIDGSYAKAMEELGKLCVIETNDPWVWSSLGECYVNTGDDQKAAKNFMTAYKKFLQQNDLQSALSALERVLSLDSGNKEAGENRARLLNRLSKEGIKPVQSIAKKIPIFSEIEEHELNDILKIARAISFPEGRTIIEEGSKGDSIYFIVSGIVSVSKKGKDGKDIMLDTLSDGDFFGEFGFFTGGKRQASISSASTVELYELKKQDMEDVAQRHQNVSKVLVDFYKKRVLDNIIAMTPIFSELDNTERADIIGRFELMVVEPGKVIVKEGDPGDAMYVVKDGLLQVSTVDNNGREVVLAQLGEGDIFGEVALITGKLRTATVKAVRKSRLMKLPKEDFQGVVEKYESVKRMVLKIINDRAEDTIRHLSDKG
ncbi:MAG: cyclic nucleotide-binding domain-containing protein [Deltaproteobacteria bacterium]|nr:cyclic nucleotide-binding domain-containing protein [Deltaproteobacteria bacterium]